MDDDAEASPSRRFVFDFFAKADAKPEADISLRDLATFISKALEHSDSTLTRRLDEFGHRLESMERQVAEKHGAHAVASTDLTLAEQQGLSEMSIRYPNKPGDQQATGSSSDAPAKARVGDDSFTASPSHAQKSASGVTSAPRHLQRENTQGVAKMGQAQRERYMQKFEKDEIFGKSVETLEMEKTRKLDNALAHHGHLLANWMLMPGSRFRLMWDSMTCLLVLFVAISLPYRVAFLMDYIDAGLNVVDFLIDIFFLLDICINFRTAHIHDGELIADPLAVAKQYLQMWFWLDLVSSVPFDWFLEGGLDFTTTKYVGIRPGQNLTSARSDAVALAGIVKTFKIVKLLRLLRVVRLFRYISRWEQSLISLTSKSLRMIKLILVLLFFSHWNGCFQFLLAAIQKMDDGEFDENSWVFRAGISDFSPEVQWSWSFFHAASQLLAISPGVEPPKMLSEIWVYLISMLSGATLYAVFVATVTAFFADADPSAREYRSKVDMVNQYMRYAQLPRWLRTKMRTYYQLRFPGHRAFDEDRILSELSSPLQHDVRLQKCRGVLSALNILENEDPQVAYYLCDKLKRVVYVAGDYVIREGQEAAGMYFVSAGLVYVQSTRSGDDVLTTLGAHSFFGEMALLNPTGETTASVIVRTYLEGYLLTKADFAWLERHHPVFRDYLQSAAKLRLERMKKSHGFEHGETDLNPLLDALDPVKRKLLKADQKAQHAAGPPPVPNRSTQLAAAKPAAEKPTHMQRHGQRSGLGGNHQRGSIMGSLCASFAGSTSSRSGTPRSPHSQAAVAAPTLSPAFASSGTNGSDPSPDTAEATTTASAANQASQSSVAAPVSFTGAPASRPPSQANRDPDPPQPLQA